LKTPLGWRTVSLGDIAHLRYETVDPANAAAERYVGLEHIDSGSLRIKRWGSPSDVRSAKSRFYTGDLLYAKLRPYLDKGAIAEWEGICSTDILVMTPSKEVDAYFLGSYMHQSDFLRHASSMMTGVNHPRTSWHSLSSFGLLLPPLKEQRAIASVLRTIQQAKEATEKVILATREFKRSLMRHLFIYGSTSTNEADRVPLKETEIGLMPKHWELRRLGEMARIERGKFAHRPRNDPAFYGGDVPFIQTGDVTAAAARDGRLRTYSQTLNDRGLGVSRLFPRGTLAITIAANIGYATILEFDAAFPDSIIAITPKDSAVSSGYLNYYIATQQAEMDRLAPRGTQKNINIQFLAPWPVKVPPSAEQQQILEILKAVDQKIRAEQLRQDALGRIFDALLSNLMNGRGRVAHVEVA